jgi:hypothetical protein
MKRYESPGPDGEVVAQVGERWPCVRYVHSLRTAKCHGQRGARSVSPWGQFRSLANPIEPSGQGS